MKTKTSTTHLLLTARVALLALVGTALLHAPAHGQITQRWLTQWGTSGEETGSGVAVDAAGTTWGSGSTSGDLGGTNAGSNDIFLTPLSTTGVVGTSMQRGGTGSDTGMATALVGGSKVFVVGHTNSPIWDGAAAIGIFDAFAVGYSTAGVWQSTARYGSTTTDFVNGAAGNATHLLVAGRASGTIDGQAQVGVGDAFLSKRDSTGALVWTRVVGTTTTDSGEGTAFDSAGNAYLVGYTAGSMPAFTSAGGFDLFVARYDANGNQTLLKQWGTSSFDFAYNVKVDGSGNIYLTGQTVGDLSGQTNNGRIDAFLTKLDSSGSVLWTRLLGGTGDDTSTELVLDAAGRVWIGGYSDSAFAGHSGDGSADAFVAEYDGDGNLLNTAFWGTAGDDRITGMAAAPDGSVSVRGFTDDTLGMASAGGKDAWAASLTTVPEPTSAALLLGGGTLLALRRRRSPAGA